MTDQMSLVRAATFAEFAAKLRAFAARQEEKAPGRMDHIVGPAVAAANLATLASAAYENGDKDAAKALRAEYTSIIAANTFLNGVA